MAAAAGAVGKLPSHASHVDLSKAECRRRVRLFLHSNPAAFGGISCPDAPGRRRWLTFQPCRSFRSEDGGGQPPEEKAGDRADGVIPDERGPRLQGRRKGGLYSLKSLIVRFTGTKSQYEGQYKKAVEKAEAMFFSFATHFGRYLVTMMSTGVILSIGFQLSGGDSQMNTLIWYSWLGGIVIGTMVGANMVLEEHCRAGPRNIVITGSTRGLGKALAREFLLSGDRVVIASRSPESVQMTVEELEENIKEGMSVAGRKSKTNLSHAKVIGTACDVCKPDDVRKLADFAVNELGTIDIWINNAGMNKGFRPLLQFTDEDIVQIVSTNLVGSLVCTREAMRIMNSQEKGGHIFNMDGAGSGGSSTPLTAVYGSTKCGLRQFQASLLKECRRSKVGAEMSSLRNAVSRRAHKERAQPHDRRKFGLLEKHKDYVVRAKAFHQKEETLRKLREKAAFRNPDEFYFKMVKTRTVDGVHRPESIANKYSQEELMLMKTQDAGYILQKIQSDRKKIEKLSSMLHSLDREPQNKHVYFAEDREEAREMQLKTLPSSRKSGFGEVPDNIKRKMEGSYRELEERKGRVNELEKVYMDMVLKKELQKKGRKRKLREDEIASPTTKPIYKWRTERKR